MNSSLFGPVLALVMLLAMFFILGRVTAGPNAGDEIELLVCQKRIQEVEGHAVVSKVLIERIEEMTNKIIAQRDECVAELEKIRSAGGI